jgi:hypothetical protein
LDTTQTFFHNVKCSNVKIFTGFVHTFVTGYNELFKALAIEGNVLLLRPIPDFGSDVLRWEVPTSKMFLYLKFFKGIIFNTVETQQTKWNG